MGADHREPLAGGHRRAALEIRLIVGQRGNPTKNSARFRTWSGEYSAKTDASVTSDGESQMAKLEMLFTSARQASIPSSVISTTCLETPLAPRDFS